MARAAVDVAYSIAWRGYEVESRAGDDGGARGRLAGFRGELYGCLTARADVLFELVDAVLCADGPVRVLAGLSLVPGFGRGHGAVYDALNAGRVDVRRLRWAVGAVPLPAWPDRRIRLAADVCCWLRPEAVTSPERMFCHVHGRGNNAGQMIPGWPYSFVAALGPGGSWWTAPLDAVRLGPDEDATAGTARYGTVQVRAWDRVHAKLDRDSAWHDHPGKLPVIEGTLIQLRPGCRELRPMWLWASVTGAGPGEIAALWQAYLRRFDIEHTFRFFKQVLGWDAPKLRDPAAADRWTWLIIAAYTQLRLARRLAADLRLPWQRPQPPGAMTPARVRRGFRAVRETVATPAAPPRPSRPGPGRPKGSPNRHKAPRHHGGKRHPRGKKRTKRQTAAKQPG